MNRVTALVVWAPTDTPSDDQVAREALGVRTRLAFCCKRCHVFHVQGEQPYQHHLRHATAEPELYLTTEIADYRRDRQRGRR